MGITRKKLEFGEMLGSVPVPATLYRQKIINQ